MSKDKNPAAIDEVAAAAQAAPEAAAAAEAASAPTMEETVAEANAESTVCELVTVRPPDGRKGLNLRSGPGKQYSVLSVLEEGSKAGVLELPMGVEVPGWALAVAGDDVAGWIDRRYIRPVEG